VSELQLQIRDNILVDGIGHTLPGLAFDLILNLKNKIKNGHASE
jgi:hypothetical protein